MEGELAGRVEFVPVEREPEIIAGLDCAFSGDGKRTFAVVVVLRVKPVFVFVGHEGTLDDAIRITLVCATR
jgi:deoxyinosine 3'endonuclease (endonuclease V)